MDIWIENIDILNFVGFYGNGIKMASIVLSTIFGKYFEKKNDI